MVGQLEVKSFIEIVLFFCKKKHPVSKVLNATEYISYVDFVSYQESTDSVSSSGKFWCQLVIMSCLRKYLINGVHITTAQYNFTLNMEEFCENESVMTIWVEAE